MFVSVALQMRSLVLQILSTRTDGIHPPPPAKRPFIKLFLSFADLVIIPLGGKEAEPFPFWGPV